jgi:hypothetical protein
MILERPPRPNLGTARKIEVNATPNPQAIWVRSFLEAPAFIFS